MKKNNYPGKFIVFEGIDGSGKTTQARLLIGKLGQKGHSVVFTHEPYKNVDLKYMEDLEPIERQKLFIEDRREHLEEIILTALELGKIVICDRYFFSTLAYGMSEDIKLEKLIAMHEEILGDKFILPDHIFILDVSEEEAMARLISKKLPLGHFEKNEKLKKIRDAYAELYEKNKLFDVDIDCFDSLQPIDIVHEQVLDKTMELFKAQS